MVQSYYDNAGLYRKYGPDKATAKTAGEYHVFGRLHEIEVKITAASLTQAEVILDDIVVIPAGARIQNVQVVTHTACATGTAIDLGLTATDRSTEIDFNGLLAAIPTSAMDLAGETVTFSAASTSPASVTGTGALIGTTLSSTGHISASMTDATSFTAGVIYVTIRYYMP